MRRDWSICARYYSPNTARFIAKDPWKGDYNQPENLNGWSYVDNDSVNHRDPSGLIRQGDEATAADKMVDDLSKFYRVNVVKDWGLYKFYGPSLSTGYPIFVYYYPCSAQVAWLEGDWTLDDLKTLQSGC